ncbi:U3 small nucleolar RNA-associated protein 6, putative [Bodo saltans]|uniref:U3 small nucleolar RNA-associated protein 6, putative n=1 Tax=Bodo saltans TaxID=75058 RepID=A0A0S4JJ14_BODSA|nr:U3 small nucleolar RNA-associated protein 6, putative [Bodo saltans]|eukprot:CUG89921.1 U3 small nucleolar RNA-associated protein 6, putative [Bodo saltans]
MSRSRAIDTRLEKLVPSVEELLVAGVFTRPEIKEINRKRTDCEYRLVAKPLLLLDVRLSIALEMGIEEKITEYCAASKVVLKHRWAVQERIEQIYKIGLKHLHHPDEYESLRKEFVKFLTKYKRASSLSQHYADLVIKNPLKAPFWVEAALWQSEVGEIDNARTSVQHAISLLPNSDEVYSCALIIELQFAGKLFTAMVKEHQERVEAAKANNGPAAGNMIDRLRNENTSLAVVALDLGLCKLVVNDALSKDGAATPALVLRLYDTAMRYPFAKHLGSFILQEGIRQRFIPAIQNGAGRLEERRWEAKWLTAESGKVICKLAGHELHCCSGFNMKHPVVPVERYLEDAARGLKKRKSTTPGELRSALLNSIATCFGLLFSTRWQPAAISSKQLFDLVYEPLQSFFTVSLLGFETTVAGPHQKGADVVTQSVVDVPVQSTVLRTVIGFVCSNLKPSKSNLHLWSDAPLKTIATTLAVEEGNVPAWKELVQRASALFNTADDSAPQSSTHYTKPPTWSIPVALKCLTPGELVSIGLTSSSSSAIITGSTAIDTDAVDDHLVQQLVSLESSNEEVPSALCQLLVGAGLVSTDMATTQRVPAKCPLWTSVSLSVNAWKLWFVAELAKPTTVSSVLNKPGSVGSSSSDSDDDESSRRPIKKPRTENARGALPAAFLGSFGAVGALLAGRSAKAYAKLSNDEALHRCLGFTRLTHLTLVNILNVSTLSRDEIVSRLQESSPEVAKQQIRAVEQVFGFVLACPPLPRQILSGMLVPFREALVVLASTPAERATAIREARNAHEQVISHYRQARAANDDRSPLTNAVYRLNRDTPALNQHTNTAEYTAMSSAELNCRDWTSYVQFERHVAKDLSTSIKIASRARQDAIDPHQVVVMMSTSQ